MLKIHLILTHRTMKGFLLKTIEITLATFTLVVVCNFSIGSAVGLQDQELWQEDSSQNLTLASQQDSNRSLLLNKVAMKRLLDQAPEELYLESDGREAILPLPLPDGSMIHFRIMGSSVMEPSLIAKYPQIRTYKGQSLQNPMLIMRCDYTPQGFHATVLGSEKGTINIHPVNDEIDTIRYVSRYESQTELPDRNFNQLLCMLNIGENVSEREDANDLVKYDQTETNSPLNQYGSTIRAYRIAVVAPYNYCEIFGNNTAAGTIASIVTTINQVNLVFERDLAVRFVLVDAPQLIFSRDLGFFWDTDPFTFSEPRWSGIPCELEGHNVLRDRINVQDYDIGHTFLIGNCGNLGGGALLGGVCKNNYRGIIYPSDTIPKALAFSRTDSFVGTQRVIDITTLLHELGHHLGAEHSFNTGVNICGRVRNGAEAVEPGAGSTIMSYGSNLDCSTYRSGKAKYFHSLSIEKIVDNIQTASCYSSINTTNRPPVVSAGHDYTIPVGTPFILNATGSDLDEDVLSYNWEQIDAGRAQFPDPPYNDRGDPPNMTTRPIFRSYLPSNRSDRIFPSLQYILEYANDPPETDIYDNRFITGEALPAVARDLNFAVTVRDNRGGVAVDKTKLTIATGSQPFKVIYPNGTQDWANRLYYGTTLTVTWSVGNTDKSPINCSQVKITLSIDNGDTFPITLSLATPNDGSETVTLPWFDDRPAVGGRVKVEAVGNIFFDISDGNSYIARPEPLGVGIYDDRHINWRYQGNWNNWEGSGPWNNTLKWSSDQNAKATIQINGTAFRIRYTTATNRTPAMVRVDNSILLPINPLGLFSWQSVYTKVGLSPGVHTITILHLGGSGAIDIDAIEVFTPPSPLGTGIYDDNHPNWNYSGAWNRWSGQGPYGGTLTYSSNSSASTSIQIYGTAFRIYYTKANNRGILGIRVDGLFVGKQSANSDLSWQSVYQHTGLSNGPHTIEIYQFFELGTGGANAVSTIDIDAIEVLPEPLGQGIYDDRHANLYYTGNWITAVGTPRSGLWNGTVKFTTDLNARALFLINGTAFRLRYQVRVNGGILAVNVDGKKLADINLNLANYDPNTLHVYEYEKMRLSNGVHTIEIKHGGGGGEINVDAIEVFTPSEPITVETGVYDDTNPNWIYTGMWVNWNGWKGPDNNSLSYTTDVNATASIKIRGTAFRLFYTKASNRGGLGIYVDEQKVADVNANGSFAWQSVYEQRGLSSGVHTVEIRHGGAVGAPIDIDAIEVFSPTTVGTGVYDDRHPSWIYNGGWLGWGGSGPYSGTLTHSSDLSARATIQINGTAFRLFYTKASNRGILGIYVDGQKVADVNANGPLAWRSVYEQRGLSSGVHTVEVRHGGGGTFIDIDAIEVFTSTPVGAGIYDDRDANWLYNGGWLRWGGSGPSSGTVSYTSNQTARATIQINGTAFRLYYTRASNYGTLGIYVDGQKVADVNANGPLAWRSVYEQRGLSSGIHTVEVRHGGGGTFIDIDAIEVFVP
jgi:hypothetical protein